MKSYAECFKWSVFGVDFDNRLVRRYFSSRICAEKWADANLAEIWRVERV